jgi:uncharacterized membrane protein YcjF (UPF0283 family)
MFKSLWHMIRNILLVIGALLGFFVLIELFRIFVMFYRFNPILGYTVALVMVVGLLLAWMFLWRQWVALPRALVPPAHPEGAEVTHRDLKAFCRYLADYLERLAGNPHLDATQKELAWSAIDYIEDTLEAHPLNEDLHRTIEKTDAEVVTPLLNSLEARASREVRQGVRDAMLAVTVSPFHSVDLLVVLYRNARIVLQVARIYGARPAGPDQWLVLRETLRVVATVNFLHLGRTLTESLFSKVPVIGGIIDDIGEGLGAGFFTAASGRAAMERCAAYRGWNRDAAVRSLAGQTRGFLEDVRDIFITDVFPDLKNRILSCVPEEKTREPGFWDTLSRDITSSVDATSRTVGSIVLSPAEARTTSRQVRRAPRGTAQALRTFGQRIKYSFRKKHRPR